MNMCNKTFEVHRLNTYVFKKSSEKNILTIIFVVKSRKGFGWNNVGPASQTVAHQFCTIGPMYRVIRVVAFRGIKRHPYGSQIKHGQSPNSISMLGQRRIRWPALNQPWAATLGKHWTGIGWVGLHCVYQVHRIDAYTDLSAMVVEKWAYTLKIYLSPWFFSIIISWTFRILAHEENQYSYVYKILGQCFD